MTGEGTPDEGHAVHYSAVRKGVAVYSSDGTEVGRVHRVLDNHREHIFDGLVFEDRDGELRWADAPEVERTAERAVTLAIDAEAALRLGPPESGRSGPASSPGLLDGLSRLFRRG